MAGAEEKNWGDVQIEEEEEEYGAARIESQLDDSGFKTITEYTTNEQGQRVKVTKRVHVSNRTVRTNKNVESRKRWEKFGLARGIAKGVLEEGVTYAAYDDVFIEPPKKKTYEETEQQREEPVAKRGAAIVLCRICGKQGDHWTLNCPYRNNPELARQGGAAGAAAGEKKPEAKPAAAAAASTESSAPGVAKYVPIHLRNREAGAGGDDDRRDRDRDRDDSCTVRVTNLSEDVREADLYDLFGPFGTVARVFLAKDKTTNQSKGFAFVNFLKREDAQKAINAVNGHGYDHLILQVEWARPSQR